MRCCKLHGMTHREQQHDYEDKLAAYIATHQIAALQLSFAVSCHSVTEAAAAAGVTAEDFIKTICMQTKDGQIIAAIVKGEDRADRRAIQELLGMGKLSIASPADMLTRTGFPAGGTPPFGFDAQFVMDERVFELQEVFGGGGSEFALIRAAPTSIQRANRARIAPIRAMPSAARAD
jgi:Cys-tRNA(Pro)/Cys-tRNA(Cys) deacylase